MRYTIPVLILLGVITTLIITVVKHIKTQNYINAASKLYYESKIAAINGNHKEAEKLRVKGDSLFKLAKEE